MKETGLIAKVRGEATGMVFGIECAPRGNVTSNEMAIRIIEACYLGDDQGRAIHLLGPLAGKVIRVSPPLVMPVAEAEEYLGVLFEIFAAVGKKVG